VKKAALLLLGMAICLLPLPSATAERGATTQIEIRSPASGAEVEVETLVEGWVSDPKAQVYVLVRALRTKYWWVQRLPAPANRDGTWQTQVNIGTETEGIGEPFEIVALVTKRKLHEGAQMDVLPERTAISDAVRVQRRKAPSPAKL
jgi:hypothetical protein